MFSFLLFQFHSIFTTRYFFSKTTRRRRSHSPFAAPPASRLVEPKNRVSRLDWFHCHCPSCFVFFFEILCFHVKFFFFFQSNWFWNTAGLPYTMQQATNNQFAVIQTEPMLFEEQHLVTFFFFFFFFFLSFFCLFFSFSPNFNSCRHSPSASNAALHVPIQPQPPSTFPNLASSSPFPPKPHKNSLTHHFFSTPANRFPSPHHSRPHPYGPTLPTIPHNSHPTNKFMH
jgi:hypothetical protein